MTKRFLEILSIVTFLICISYSQLTAQTMNTNPSFRFPTKGRKDVTVLKRLDVNADSLKTLLVVPNNSAWIEIGKKLNYFQDVMTVSELQSSIIAKGLTDKIPSISDKIGLYNACVYYRHSVMLILSSEDLKTQGFRTRLSLYDPIQSEAIFKDEVRLNLMWEGYSDQKVLNPLLNSLMDYLHEQK